MTRDTRRKNLVALLEVIVATDSSRIYHRGQLWPCLRLLNSTFTIAAVPVFVGFCLGCVLIYDRQTLCADVPILGYV